MKRLATLTLFVVLVALLAACAAPTPQVIEKEVVVEKVLTPTPVPIPPEVKVRAESLNIGIDTRLADPSNFNFYVPGGPSRADSGQVQLVYEFFFQYNKMTDEYVPWLAESYEYNDDFTAITVKLRDGVTWNDGKPFTADDVVFTYELLRDNPGMTWAVEATDKVDSVEKLDALTVKFNLKSPNPRFHLIREAFPANMGWSGIVILPKHIWEGKDPLTFKNKPPVGTGPYRLVNATETTITYERRDDWWATKAFGVVPAPKIVNWLYYGSETSAALAMAANDLDLPQMGFSLSAFQAVTEKNPKVRAWYTEPPYASIDPCPRPLMVQNEHAPWDKKEARWALSYLIDREAVVNLAFGGTTMASWGVWPYFEGLKPYFDAIQDLIEKYPTTAYDPAKAEELLQSIGYQKGADGAWVSPEGKKLQVTYLVNADSGREMRTARVVADQLRAAGIEVTVQPLSGSVLADAILRGDYDLKMHSFCPGFIYDNLELFHSKYYVPLGERAPWYERNSFRYKNPAFDAIVDEMAVTPPSDVDKIKEQFHRAMEIWFEDLPVIPLIQTTNLLPFNTTYWVGWPSAEQPWNVPMHWDGIFAFTIFGFPSPKTGEWVGGLRPAGGE